MAHICALLRRTVPDLSDVTEQEILELSWPTRERVFASLFKANDIASLSPLIERRCNDRKVEASRCIPTARRTTNEDTYRKVFTNAVVKALTAMTETISTEFMNASTNTSSLPPTTTANAGVCWSATKFINNRSHCYAAFSLLLTVLNSRNIESSKGDKAVREKEKQPNESENKKILTRRKYIPKSLSPRATIASHSTCQPVRKKYFNVSQGTNLQHRPPFCTATTTSSESTIPSDDEVSALRAEIEHLRAMHQQLLEESHNESLDERRVVLLKSLNMQLERQVLLLSETCRDRSSCLLTVENGLADAIQWLRPFSSGSSGDENELISLKRSDFDSLKQRLERLKVRLYKCEGRMDTASEEERPLIMVRPFTRQPAEPVSVLDVCSGKIGHLNLRHISRLESQLLRLRKSLLTVSETSKILISPELLKPECDRWSDVLSEALNLTHRCASDLLCLALLVPNAPLPELDRCFSERDIPLLPELDEIMAMLPQLTSASRDEIFRVLDGALKTVRYTHNILRNDVVVLRKELEFHSSHRTAVYDLASVVSSEAQAAANELDSIVSQCLSLPLRDILSHFDDLSESTDESSLRNFLSSFKKHAPTISTAIGRIDDTVTKPQHSISTYGRQFADRVAQLKLHNNYSFVKE